MEGDSGEEVALCSLGRNPLARSPGQVIGPSDKRNFIGTSPNGQVNFLLLDLYLHDHQNVFSKEFNFIMTIFHVRGSTSSRRKRVYKTIPAIVSTEASAIVKCRKRNNDDGNEPEIPEIKKLRSEIQIKTFESAGFSLSQSAEGKHTYF